MTRTIGWTSTMVVPMRRRAASLSSAAALRRGSSLRDALRLGSKVFAAAVAAPLRQFLSTGEGSSRGVFVHHARDNKAPPPPMRSARPAVGSSRQNCIAMNASLRSSRSVEEVLSLYERRGHSFDVVNISTAIHRIAKHKKQHVCDDPRFAMLIAQANSSLLGGSGWKPRQLANVAWAVAKLGDNQLFQALERVSLGQIEAFGPRELATTAWAFATAGVEAPRLVEAIARAASLRIRYFEPADLSLTAWAFATSRVEAPTLFRNIAVASQRRIEDFEPKELVNTVWAFTKLQVEAPHFYARVAQAAVLDRPERLTARDISTLLWAFAATEVHAASAAATPPAAFAVLARRAAAEVEFLTPQGLAVTVWSLTNARLAAPTAFDILAASARLDEFDPQALSMTAWAYSAAGHGSPKLFAAIAEAALTKVADFELAPLCTTVWAILNAGGRARPLERALAEKLRHEEDVSVVVAKQLHHVRTFLCIEDPDHELVLLIRPPREKRGGPSEVQREISKALHRIGFSHQGDIETKEGITLSMAQLKTKIAVQYDGPDKYHVDVESLLPLEEKSRTTIRRSATHHDEEADDDEDYAMLPAVPQPNGKWISKQRLLRTLGWKCVHVPYYEWEYLHGSMKAQDDYLSRRIRSAKYAPSLFMQPPTTHRHPVRHDTNFILKKQD